MPQSRETLPSMAGRGEIRIGWPFRKLRNHPLLGAMLERLDLDGDAVAVGWGARPSGLAARKDAAATGCRLLLLEDAMVRSLKPGQARVYGLVADSRGFYQEPSGPSDLLAALNGGTPAGWMNCGPGDPLEVARLMARFRRIRASTSHWYPGDFRKAPRPEEPGVMVVHQAQSGASPAPDGTRVFDRMVRDALDEHPQEPVYVRTAAAPAGFPQWVMTERRVKPLPPDLSAAACFEFCREIYVPTSPVGMEGLIHGRTVKTYGWNFYAGWGLTEDRGAEALPNRETKIDMQRLFEAAYLQYAHYFDPDDGEPCGLDRILDHLEIQQTIWAQDAGTRVTVGWKPWKRGLAEDFVNGPGSRIRHAGSFEESVAMAAAGPDGKLMVWGAAPAHPRPTAPVIRVEDGFLRSSGLGAMFHRPLSWVFDDVGIYFDSRSPSRLEHILQAGDFSASELAEAAELAAFLRERRLTKYNLSGAKASWSRREAKGRKVILVPGQVEADASIACGSPDVRSNSELLNRVRESAPAAFLIYKVHPDLVAGARHGSVLPDDVRQLADLIVTAGNVLDWLDECDEVHTMTSTVGFEALIRRVPVVTYGLPFYAAWGLTTDRLDCPRRNRRLTLEELVCGALMRYPRYLNPETGEFTTALKAAGILALHSLAGDRRTWHLKAVSKLKKLWVELARR